MSSAVETLQHLPREDASLINVVRDGLDAALALGLQEEMGVTQEVLASLIQVPASTLRRKIRRGERLDPSASERIIELQRLCSFG